MRMRIHDADEDDKNEEEQQEEGEEEVMWTCSKSKPSQFSTKQDLPCLYEQ